MLKLMLAGLALMLCCCSSGYRSSEVRTYNSLFYPLDSIPPDTVWSTVNSSNDMKLCIYTWGFEDGGHSIPHLGQVAVYRSSSGQVVYDHRNLLDVATGHQGNFIWRINRIYTCSEDSLSIYLVELSITWTSYLGGTCMLAFTIEDSLRSAHIFRNNDEMKSYLYEK